MHNTLVKLKNKILSIRIQLVEYFEKILIFIRSLLTPDEVNFSDLLMSRHKRNYVYRKFQVNFSKFDPEWLRAHRQYFKHSDRGFGEDAFHSYWLSLIKYYKPNRLLEIGVYRGQTISLWALIAIKLNIKTDIYGISPLDNTGDMVSAYPEINYEKDIIKNFKYFNLPNPNLIKGLSKNNLNFIKNGNWDLIYIDGSHDYMDVKFDLQAAYLGLKVGGILVLDDSSLYTNFRPRISNTFRGHPGPSKVFTEINGNAWKFLLGIGHNNIFQKIL